MKRKTGTLTPKEVGKYLKLTPATITRMCRAGQMEGAFKVGRVWRIPYDSSTLHSLMFRRARHGRV